MLVAKGPDDHSIGSEVPQRRRLALDRLWMTRWQRRWAAIDPMDRDGLRGHDDDPVGVAEAARSYHP